MSEIMTVGELVAAPRRYDGGSPVYVYDEHSDQERTIDNVGAANELMPNGVVVSIRGVLPVDP